MSGHLGHLPGGVITALIIIPSTSMIGCSATDARFDENIDFQTEGIGVFGNFDDAIAQLKQNTEICGTPLGVIASVETLLRGSECAFV